MIECQYVGVPDDERIAKVACFGLITDDRGRVLLVRLSYGGRLWALPGGMAMPGEVFAETVRREVLEETGLEVEVSNLVAVADAGTLIVTVFRSAASQTVTTRQEEEIDECRWFDPDELRELDGKVIPLARHVAEQCVEEGKGLVQLSVSGAPPAAYGVR